VFGLFLDLVMFGGLLGARLGRGWSVWLRKAFVVMFELAEVSSLWTIMYSSDCTSGFCVSLGTSTSTHCLLE